MRGGLRSPILRMRRIQQDAGAGDLVEGVEARDLCRQSAGEDSGAQLEFPEPRRCLEPVRSLSRATGGARLRPAPPEERHSPGDRGPFGRIVTNTPHPQKSFKLKLGLDQGGQQLHRLLNRCIGLAGAAEAWLEIDLHCLSSKERIDRNIIY